MAENEKEIKKIVKEHYAKRMQQEDSSCCAPRVQQESTCCPTAARSRAAEYYSKEELAKLPQDAVENYMGCGNPIALAELGEGEVVLDLGSGAGLDCLFAAQKVGDEGKVLGLDMTLEMIKQARENSKKLCVDNVEFRLGEIEQMPIESNSIDVVISNCVINLSPDKDAVFRESYRVLRPRGRLCVSDIVLIGELDSEVKNDINCWVSCIAGALPQEEYLDKISAAGFDKVEVVDSTEWVPKSRPEEIQQSLKGKLASIKVKAFKP